MPDIQFLTNEADKVEGLAYAGFETFRGSPYTSCARETGQNSRDAAIGGGPVLVRFNLLSIPQEEIPFAGHLKQSIERCLEETHDEKTKQHLRQALDTISGSKVKVLAISDENTTGLTGPTNDPTSVFAALVKGDGVTNKSDPTSAGSFGIGKNATYAVSDLQTVIYSTCYEQLGSESIKFAAQGRLRLVSHRDGNKKYSAEGYWGNPGFAAIEDQSLVPAWMVRATRGTSIFCMGFREQDHWVERMTLSLVTNFFLAIERKEIEFSVDNIHITQSSLDSILASPVLQQIAADADELEHLERARRLVECMRSDATQREQIAIQDLGDFTLHVLVKEGMPRDVHILRNGIYITDNFSKFSEPLRRFPGTKEFTAVLEPAKGLNGNKPSTLLKQMENPAHDALEPERIVSTAVRELAKTQIKQLTKRLRAFIKSVAKIEDVSRSQLDELSHLFADRTNRGEKGIEEDPARYIYGIARKGRRVKPYGTKGKGAAKGGVRDVTSNLQRQARRPAGKHPALPIREFRSVFPDTDDARRRTIYFTPEADGAVEIALAAAGLSADVELPIVATATDKTVEGRIHVTVKEGERVRLDVEFAEPFAGPIELLANTVVVEEVEK